jgi:hypothetical protein
MKRYYLVSLLALLGNSNVVLSQTFQFIRESIEIVIGNDYTTVTGVYEFRNNSNQDITRSLFFPFPINDVLHYPDSIQVFDEKNNSILFKKSSKGIHFSISSPPNSEISIKVKYTQRFLSNEVRYILKSTQTWKQPLEKAEYKILLPLEFELQEISLTLDKQDLNSAYNIFYIHKENFMPDKDLIIKWAGRK